MSAATDLTTEMCYLKAVIDAADFIDNESSFEGSVHTRNLVTSLIHVAAKLAEDMQRDIEALSQADKGSAG